MTPRVPPRVATWLLTRLRGDESEDSLLGDLIEEFHSGRSVAWYWKQTLVMIALSLVVDFRTHTLLAIRAAVFSAALLWLFGVFQRPFVSVVFQWLLNAGWTSPPHPVPDPFHALVWCLTGISGGWIVGRTHKSIWGLAVLLAAAVQVLYNARWTWELTVMSIGSPLYRPYLAGLLAMQLILVLGLLAGGLLSATGARSKESRSLAVRP
jgi:hypothetical protein